jgi:hypothetical protein
MTLAVHIYSTAVKENFLKTMCVGSVASGSLVLMTATVHRVNVVILITNVQQRALENRVPIMATVLLVNIVAIIMKDVKPLAL